MRVLLIEDDSAAAQSIELMLKSESFTVYTTDLGEEGIDLGKIYDYDIILLDLNLPDMSGFEVLRSLRISKVKTPFRPRGYRGQGQGIRRRRGRLHDQAISPG
jgi:two-component system cell cycle response regulator CtrA